METRHFQFSTDVEAEGFKKAPKYEAGSMPQVVEHLPSKH
jgi:hypothetical protein